MPVTPTQNLGHSPSLTLVNPEDAASAPVQDATSAPVQDATSAPVQDATSAPDGQSAHEQPTVTLEGWDGQSSFQQQCSSPGFYHQNPWAQLSNGQWPGSQFPGSQWPGMSMPNSPFHALPFPPPGLPQPFPHHGMPQPFPHHGMPQPFPQNGMPQYIPVPVPVPIIPGYMAPMQRTGMSSSAMEKMAHAMESTGWSLVDLREAPHLNQLMTFEYNPYKRTSVVGMSSFEADRKMKAMMQQGWMFEGKRELGSFNHLLTFTRNTPSY